MHKHVYVYIYVLKEIETKTGTIPFFLPKICRRFLFPRVTKTTLNSTSPPEMSAPNIFCLV